MSTGRKRPGRPSLYSHELAESICTRVSGGESLHAICRDPDMPSRDAVYSWMAAHREFSDNYARAREIRADLIADEIIDIADTDEDPNRARVRIDARKWAAGKMAPKRYGDRIVHAGDADAPMQHQHRDIKIVIVDANSEVSGAQR